MLSIGEFSNICKVSTKTLRYYAEIGLLEPSEVNPENGYRYYSIEQLEKMLFINRLKEYSFSLEEIKELLLTNTPYEENLYFAFVKKKNQIEKQLQTCEKIIEQISNDLITIEQGKSIMSYMDNIDVQLVDVPLMYLLSIRKKVQPVDYPTEYEKCFGKLFRKIATEKLTMIAPPMVLFHSDEFTPNGLDTEFAIPVQEYAKGTRDFSPGLCLKTVVRGAYSELPSVYAKQVEWAEKEGYQNTNALFEIYITDPSQITDVNDNITEVYYPVKKITSKN